MPSFDELVALIGPPNFDHCDPAAWSALEEYLGSELPTDYKRVLDAYGSGMFANTLIVTHPACEPDAVAHQMRFQEMFVGVYDDELIEGAYPGKLHPAPGGLVFWGSGGVDGFDHFFLPCAPDPDEWKIVSLHEDYPYRVYDGTFSAFVVDVVTRWIAPLPDDEWDRLLPQQKEWRMSAAAAGEFTPGFRPFW